MSSDKPNFLSQPVVKNVFMFRNGDPHYEARRIVINHKRVCNFETLLREVTGGIQAPFGAVRNIYTPTGGHKVDRLESLQSGENYLHISLRKKRQMQSLPVQVKPVPQNRIIVSARFLKPIKEPCPIFVVANGDVLNPAIRLLIHQRMLGQFDRILETVTEKMGLRVLGGVRSLYTYEGQQVTDGNQLESGQLYVAVGRERFKKLPYSDLLFTKPRGTRRVNGMKAYSLPPIYRFSKQNGNPKSVVRTSHSGDSNYKISPPTHGGTNKEHLSSIVREISQARLLSLRKRRSGQSMTLCISDNDDLESKADQGNTEKSTHDLPAEEKSASVSEEDGEKPKAAAAAAAAAAEEEEEEEEAEEEEEEEEEEEASAENTTEEDTSSSREEKMENESHSQRERKAAEENKGPDNEKEGKAAAAGPEEKGVKEVKEEASAENTVEEDTSAGEAEGKGDGEATGEIAAEGREEIEEPNNEKEGEVKALPEEEVGDESGEEPNSSRSSGAEKTRDIKGKAVGDRTPSEGDKNERNDAPRPGENKNDPEDPVNDAGEDQEGSQNTGDPGKSDNETNENARETKEGTTGRSGSDGARANREAAGDDGLKDSASRD